MLFFDVELLREKRGVSEHKWTEYMYFQRRHKMAFTNGTKQWQQGFFYGLLRRTRLHHHRVGRRIIFLANIYVFFIGDMFVLLMTCRRVCYVMSQYYGQTFHYKMTYFIKFRLEKKTFEIPMHCRRPFLFQKYRNYQPSRPNNLAVFPEPGKFFSIAE